MNTGNHNPMVTLIKRSTALGRMCRITVVICLLATTISAHAENFALLIGVGEFPKIEEGAINLPGIDIDLKNMASMMQQLDVPAENIKQLYNRSASKAAVVNALRQMASQLTADDRVYVYFSTHGGQIKNFGGDIEVDGYDEFLAFSDLETLVQRDLSSDEERRTLDGILLDDELAGLLSDISAKTVVIIDACASATATKGLGGLLSGDDKLRAIGKFVSAGWMRRAQQVDDKEVTARERFDTPVRDNLIVMAAAQDHQDAAATAAGSRYTSALISAVKNADSSAMLTPYCLHRVAHLDITSNPRYAFQVPEFAGRFELSNIPLSGSNASSSLEQFNQCLDGTSLLVRTDKRGSNARSTWRTQVDNQREGYVQVYIEDASGIRRLQIAGERNRPRLIEPAPRFLPGATAMWQPGHGPEGIDFLMMNFADINIAEKVDLTMPGWANLLNNRDVDVISGYARL